MCVCLFVGQRRSLERRQRSYQDEERKLQEQIIGKKRFCYLHVKSQEITRP